MDSSSNTIFSHGQYKDASNPRHTTQRLDGFANSSSPSPIQSPLRTPSRNSNGLHPECKTHRGLRLYGKLVLEKVKQLGTTNFDEVADEIHRYLVDSDNCDSINDKLATKSTRRRVYDVLNVLFAMGMVTKDGKNIKWISEHPEEIPLEQVDLEKEKKQVKESIRQKTTQLQDLLLQIIAYESLLLTKKHVQKRLQKDIIHLPFIVVKTNKNTDVNCRVSNDKFQHLFTFDQPFAIHDDIEVLKRMGLSFGLEKKNCTTKKLEMCKTMVSRQLEHSVFGRRS